jgi:hypothetical protein
LFDFVSIDEPYRTAYVRDALSSNSRARCARSLWSRPLVRCVIDKILDRSVANVESFGWVAVPGDHVLERDG